MSGAWPEKGDIWHRTSDGRATVRIGRSWSGAWGGVFDHYVRCHPVRGGKVWVTTVDEFRKRYSLVSTSNAGVHIGGNGS